MKDIYNHYRDIVAEACCKINQSITKDSTEVKLSDFLSLSFIVEKPNNENFGDLSTNIAMISSKIFSKNPMEIADNLKKELIKLISIREKFYQKADLIVKNDKNIVETTENIILKIIN